MSDILFAGCSYTAGSGWDLGKEEPNFWVNLLHNTDKLRYKNLHNVAIGGRSNQGIFQDAVYHLTQKKYDFAFIVWTSYPRYDVHVGFETYSTWQPFSPNMRFSDHNLNDMTLDRKYLKKINDRFTMLSHPHYEIVNIIKYVSVLVKLSKILDTKIFFINALCHWDHDFFIKKNNVLPNEYTDYTKQIINVENRDDDEIFILYDKMHQEYQSAGGIYQEYWLNLYQSLRSLKIDVNKDHSHPGILSNFSYFKLLKQSLEAKLQAN
jgi:hypothetical protein